MDAEICEPAGLVIVSKLDFEMMPARGPRAHRLNNILALQPARISCQQYKMGRPHLSNMMKHPSPYDDVIILLSWGTEPISRSSYGHKVEYEVKLNH